MQTKQIEAVSEAARILGNQAKMARALEVTPVTVGQWLKTHDQGGREVPAKQCVRIERLTNGAVTRQALRADDWQDFWPELAKTQQINAQAAPETVANSADALPPISDLPPIVATPPPPVWDGIDRRAPVSKPLPPELERRALVGGA